ncbi:MAG: purine-binding chemotaxis protein CheW [Lachnospiraceae bacterium]|nr:purine-binding chemotaxis protein CheW [Lachnospiraceae bacterium]
MEEVKDMLPEQETDESSEQVMESHAGKYVTFKSGNEYFAIKIEYVNEIIVYQEITAIPESVDFLKGLINLRGKIIPVIDVRVRFKQPEIPYTDRTCIIIVNYNNAVVGLIVEKIAEVVELVDENIIPSPTFGKADKSQNKYVYAIGKVGDSVKLLLDPDKLLNEEDLAVLNQLDDEADEEAEETAGKNKHTEEKGE